MNEISLVPIMLSEESDFMNMALTHFLALNPSFQPRLEWTRNFFGSYFFDSQSRCMWVVSDEDERIGFIIYGLKPHPYNGSLVGYVYETFVDKAHRKRGVAAQAADRAIEDMAQSGAVRVDLEIVPGNQAAERLWEKRGFKPVATRYSRSL